VYLEACLRFPWVVGLGFLCILEALCILILVYLEVLYAFFWYNTLTYQKKKKKDIERPLADLKVIFAYYLLTAAIFQVHVRSCMNKCRCI
jgi:hypothetical protein